MPEAVHQVCVVAVDTKGSSLLSSGETTRPFYYRSAAKPFQAAVSQALGAALPPEHLAVACASHDGDPAHIAIAESILAGAGLDESSLRCPPDWPLGTRAKQRVWTGGPVTPRRIWHNCSGKHAAMLKACVVQGWDTEGYLLPEHPLQREIANLMVEVSGRHVLPTGTDGCGAPVFRTTAESMARAFLGLAIDDRFAEVRAAMSRYPALVSGVGNDDALVATWLGGAAKRGAEGCMGVALPGRGALAVKAWDGAGRAVAAAVFLTLRTLGWIPDGPRPELAAGLELAVLGGGKPVGVVRGVL